jgi:HPt (histidine-containing phosphotransfer) domain-containing protein
LDQRTDGPIDGATLERLAASCGGGAEGWAFVRELIHTFLEEAPAQLATLRNAVGEAEANEARLAAHTLKSNAATFGAISFMDVCRELEAASTRGELGGDVATALVEQAELEWERARDALGRVGPGGAG